MTPTSTFCDEIDLDLTCSTVVGLDRNDCQVHTARFANAHVVTQAHR